VAARIRKQLRADFDMVHGRYGEFRVLVDGDELIDGGASRCAVNAELAARREVESLAGDRAAGGGRA
jgi:hypothetical protein